jgi:ATP-dependent protease ClpP protease subunit
MTPDQRKAAMDQQHQDLQNWAKQNNIPLQYLMGGRGMGMMGKGHWKVLKDVERDFWLDAKEAKKYGIVDKIIEPKKK